MAECETYPVWEELDKIIQGYLTSVTLDQFVASQGVKRGKSKNPSNCGL
jgi:DNA-binding IscR family transcriptional regulator